MLSLQTTEDNSVTLFSEKYQTTYHSIFGAKTESETVYINLGLGFAKPNFTSLNVFEMGFGTGLNAMLTHQFAHEHNILIYYEGIDAFPLEAEIYEQLDPSLQTFLKTTWADTHKHDELFTYRKLPWFIEDFELTPNKFQVVFFDAFTPNAQPEIWSKANFQKMYDAMCPGGVLTTYCAKSDVQKTLRDVGFFVEKHPGPPKKREIIRAIK